MSVNSVIKHLKKYDLEKDIITLPTSTATVKEAAESLGASEDEIAKTLSFLINDVPIIIVMSGNSKIDNAKYKTLFHKKAKMIPFNDVENLIGHPVGGVCPFGINNGINVYLDISLKKYEYVYPACGACNNAIKINIDDLERVLDYPKWIDVTK